MRGALQSTEWNERADVSGDCSLADPRCARDILYRNAGGIEHRGFLGVRATRLTPNDEVSELRMDIRGHDQTGIDRVMKITHDNALREHVHDDLRTRQQLGGQFVLVRAVCANRCNEGSG